MNRKITRTKPLSPSNHRNIVHAFFKRLIKYDCKVSVTVKINTKKEENVLSDDGVRTASLFGV